MNLDRHILTLLMLCLICGTAQGDVFLLRDGGQFSGVLVERGDEGEYVVRSDAGVMVTLTRRQVRKVVALKDNLLEYQQRSRSMTDTVEAHHEMADWCKANQLSRQRKHHLQRIIELDPGDQLARSSLGYQKHKGQWLTRQQIMEERGLTFYEGDYRTPQEIALRQRRNAIEEAENQWYQDLRYWRRKLGGRSDASEALASIESVREPMAAPALLRLLDQEDDPEIRQLYLSVLGELRHPAAVEKMVQTSLYDEVPEIREMCLDSLLRNHLPINITAYTKALKSRENRVILRAAVALERIGNAEAISPLIDALVTRHKFSNNTNPGQMNVAFSPSGGGGGMVMGGGPQFRYEEMQNREVRMALVQLSNGQDYEFNEEAWRRWYVNTQIHDNIDTRRDQ